MLDTGYFYVKVTRFFKSMDVVCERMKNVKDDSKFYDLRNLKDSVTIYSDGNSRNGICF
jgi:hypothetical protein